MLKERFFYFVVGSALTIVLLLMLQNDHYGLTSNLVSSFKARAPSSLCSLTSSTPPPSSNKTSQLLLITTGRSGSSFTAAIIQNDPNVFFRFEPLHVMHRDVDLRNKSQSDRACKIVKSVLTCDFTEVNATDIDDDFLGRTGNAGTAFLECQRRSMPGDKHIQCLIDMIRYCRSKNVTFSKLIRFPLVLAEEFLEEFPNLKILYLIRDPRAVMHSQIIAFQTSSILWGTQIKNVSARHCDQLRRDLKTVQYFQKLYPGRVSTIRYENGALDPVGYAKKLYDFTGLKFTNKTLEYVNFLTTASSQSNNNMFGVRRSDAKWAMGKWRYSNRSYAAGKIIDGHCRDIYPFLGYLPILSEADLLSNRSLITNPQGV